LRSAAEDDATAFWKSVLLRRIARRRDEMW
jgi:hypothetical protein